MTDKEEKALMDAPCGHSAKTSKGKPYKEYPSINCDLHCEYCGFNPKEIKRRVAEGYWRQVKERTNAETDEKVDLTKFRRPVKQLVFKRKGR